MPLVDLIWVMLMWFLFFAWIAVIVGVVTDVFRSKDLGGVGKASWVLFVIVIPWLGVIVYLIARGDGLTYRYGEAAGARYRNSRVYVPQTAGYSTADQMGSQAWRRGMGPAGGLDYDTQNARILV